MAISITKADVKRKCMIPASDTSYDGSIDALISEMQPAVEYMISEVYLTDTSDTKLQSTLKLGILEIICGELLKQLAREFGSTEQFSIAGITIGQMKEQGPDLIAQGMARLAPFAKNLLPELPESEIVSNTLNIRPVFTVREGI